MSDLQKNNEITTKVEQLAKELQDAIEQKDADLVTRILQKIPPGELPHVLWHLGLEGQTRLMELIDSDEAAEMLLELPESQAAAVLEGMDSFRAAAILDEMPSNEQADLLAAVAPERSEEFLKQMRPAEAEDARRLLQYRPDTAGGLMITEYLAYNESLTVDDVIRDLRLNAEKYKNYDVLYIYTINGDGVLKGVLRVRDLLLSVPDRSLADLEICNPISVHAETSLDDLDHLFRKYRFFGLPVVDSAGRLIGMVRRQDVEEAMAERASRSFLKLLGISGGEEIRSMALKERIKGRTVWLSIILFLDLIAASVIPFFESTIAQVLALVFFLPIISDMGGNTGSQSLGVTLRELAAGLITPRDAWRVVKAELPLSLVNGLVVGFLLAAVGWIWQGNICLGVLVGSALALNTVVGALLGAAMPLGLARIGIDPALASGPILTTITDLTGFLLILGGAQLVLPWLVT